VKILDLTAGKRAIWFNKKDDRATFIDIRPEVSPDFISDSSNLPMKNNNGYNLIVFDPPHVNTGKGRSRGTKKNSFQDYYGHFTTAEIKSLIRGGAREAHRVSLPGALMAFKWNDHDYKLKDILFMMEDWWEPLFGQRVARRTKHSSSTYWVMLIRKDISVDSNDET